MNITFDVKSLKKTVSLCDKVATDTTPNPAMKCLLFDAEPNAVYVTATNGTVSLKTVVPDASVTESGRFLINAKVITDILKGANDDTLTIKDDGTKLKLSVGKAKYTLATERADSFPNISFDAGGVSVDLSHDTVLNIVNHVAIAAADRDTRPILTGVHFRDSDSGLIAEATDSFRLAQEVYPVAASSSHINVTVEAATLRLIPSVFEQDVRFYIQNRAVLFEDGTTLLKSSVLDGGYPEVERFFPSDFTYEMKVDRMDVLGALARTKFIKNDGMSIVHLEMTPTGSVLKNRNQELGESTEEVGIVVENGGDLTTNLSGQYLADALNAFTDEEYVLIRSLGDMKPFVFQAYGNDSVSMRQLLLPVRTYY